MAFVAFDKDFHHLAEMNGLSSGNACWSRCSTPRPTWERISSSGNAVKLKVRAGKIHRVGEIPPGVGQCAVKIEHDQVYRCFHRC